ncbi:MAG: glycerophosphodiester phosphodiesterase [Mycobacteriaceae bacterium]
MPTTQSRKFPRRNYFGIALLAIALAGCSSDNTSQTVTSQTPQATIDLQAHRGGRGMTIEESLPGFAKALELGVSTLELDIVLTKDNVPLIWHDPIILDTKCTDTKPITDGDSQYPYVGKIVHDLTNAQIQMLDCGSKTLENFPEQQAIPGNKVATLPQLFELVQSYHADIRFNIETKIEAEKPEQSASPQEFVNVILNAIRSANVLNKVSIQSFDWRTFALVKKAEPSIPLVALYDETTFTPGSLWLGGINFDTYHNDPIGAAVALGANVISPGYSNPYGAKVGEPGFALIADREYVQKAHHAGIKVIPWTINDKATIAAQIDTGVDGVITDYPDRMREVLKEKSLTLPTAYSAP